MAVPNLIGLWILRKEIKSTIAEYWVGFSARYPDDRMSKKYIKKGRL
jgi:AGCS family alanine or glycine:cation symporter